MPFETGPFIQSACFCDMVLVDNTNSVSLIRIIDQVTFFIQGEAPPNIMPPMHKPLTLAIMLKSGKARGRHTLKIIPELPDGSTLNAQEFSVHFDGEEKGHNVIVKTDITFTLEGLYWFLVDLDDERLTEIPLRVNYDRRVVSSSGVPNPPN